MKRRGFLALLASLPLAVVALVKEEKPKYEAIYGDRMNGVNRMRTFDGEVLTNRFDQCGTLTEKDLEDYCIAMFKRNQTGGCERPKMYASEETIKVMERAIIFG